MARIATDQPIALGTGLLAMDVILSGGPPAVAAGGTCGNVMAILGWLGWAAMPVARLNGDAAAKVVRSDLLRFGVRLDLTEQPPSTPTPVIIERLRSGPDGAGVHRFSLNCPSCRAWLPRYQAVPASAVRKLLERAPTPQVFFFDRLSRGALMLAEQTAAAGGLVWFEPSRVDDDKLFREALSLAHVLKYSRERAAELGQAPSRADGPLLEIETAGAEGLRYRGRGLDEASRWRVLQAIPAASVVDTAGAGDWVSAALIQEAGRDGLASLNTLLGDESGALTRLVRSAQAVSAVSCGFTGARGAMYALDRDQLGQRTEEHLSARRVSTVTPPELPVGHAGDSFCKVCGTPVESWA